MSALSLEGWIKLYTDEINKVGRTKSNAGLLILIAIFTAAVAALFASLQSDITPIENDIYRILAYIFIIFVIIILLCELRYQSLYQKRLKQLIPIREAIISGGVTDYERIQSEWEAYVKKYYRKYLGKPEIKKEEEARLTRDFIVGIAAGTVSGLFVAMLQILVVEKHIHPLLAILIAWVLGVAAAVVVLKTLLFLLDP
jgi:hypothetical protein